MLHHIEIDATKLAGPSVAIPGVTGTLDANVIQLLQLEPGSYSVQTHTISDTSWQFEITAQGLVDYAWILDISQGGFLTGRGSATLGILGYPITLDGHGLATTSYYLGNITRPLDRQVTHTLNLLPGRYQFNQGNGTVPEADFQVRIDGKVDYATTSDAFLTGRDTTTFGIVGLPVTLDAMQLAAKAYAIYITTNWLPNNDKHTLNLLPGHYQFQQGNGVVPEAAFEVRIDGKVDYAATSDAFLTGRDTTTFGIVGLPVTLDAMQLAAKAYAIYITTNWLPNNDKHTLNLLPGHYQFQQGNGVVPEAAFEVRIDGKVDYAATSDAFLTGRDTTTFGIVGLPVTLDAMQLAAKAYAIYITTNWLPNNDKHTLNLLPGHYQFQQGNGVVPEAAFEVRIDGKVDYAATSDAFLTGRDTTTFGIVGLPVTLDAMQLAAKAYAIYITTNWLPNNDKHTLNLLPGHYQFQQGNGVVPEAAFEVRIDGKVDYAATSDAFLTGRDTTTFGIVGLPVTLDAMQLAAKAYAIYITTNWLPNNDKHTLNLLPGHYQFQQGNGVVPEAAFEVRIDGLVDYESRNDAGASPPGVLSGRGTSNLRILGYRVQIDARAYLGNAVVLMPFGLLVDTSLASPETVSLLPEAHLSLEIRTANPRVAVFMLAGGGRVILDDAYPFIDLRWQAEEQLIRLTIDEMRSKPLCCIADRELVVDEAAMPDARVHRFGMSDQAQAFASRQA